MFRLFYSELFAQISLKKDLVLSDVIEQIVDTMCYVTVLFKIFNICFFDLSARILILVDSKKTMNIE